MARSLANDDFPEFLGPTTTTDGGPPPEEMLCFAAWAMEAAAARQAEGGGGGSVVAAVVAVVKGGGGDRETAGVVDLFLGTTTAIRAPLEVRGTSPAERGAASILATAPAGTEREEEEREEVVERGNVDGVVVDVVFVVVGMDADASALLRSLSSLHPWHQAAPPSDATYTVAGPVTNSVPWRSWKDVEQEGEESSSPMH